MKQRIFALLCAAILLLSLAACKAESSSQSTVTVTTSKTENGVTTTTTTTGEAGVTVGTDGVQTTAGQTTETTVETAAPEAPEEAAKGETEAEAYTFDDWAAQFSGGAIGANADGDRFLLAWDDPEDMTYAALMILSADGTEVMGREGPVTMAGADDNVYFLLTDMEKEEEIPFNFYSSDQGDFDMFFRGDADTATMNVVEHAEIMDAFAQVFAAIQG